MITLSDGSSVSEKDIRAVIFELVKLLKEHPLVAYDIAKVCKDPSYEKKIPRERIEIAKKTRFFGNGDLGVVNCDIKSIFLSAVVIDEEKLEIKLKDPSMNSLNLSKGGERLLFPIEDSSKPAGYLSLDLIMAGIELIDAVEKNNIKKVLSCLKKGTDINVRNEKGNTALSIATEKGDEFVMELLLRNGAPIPLNALSDAIIKKQLSIVNWLINESGEIYTEMSLNNALRTAIVSKNESIIKILLNKGANVNANDERSHTSLSLAVKNGDEAIIRLLLKKGADVTLADNDRYGRTPLHHAAEKGNLAIAKLLLQNGANINALTLDSKFTPLYLAVSNGKSQMAELLMQNGADPFIQNPKGNTVLHEAARNGCVPIVKTLLLDKKTDVNATSEIWKSFDAGTPLHWAYRRYANINTRSKEMENIKCVIELLLNAGTDIHKKDLFGKSVSEIAELYSDLGIENLILEYLDTKTITVSPHSFFSNPASDAVVKLKYT